MGKSQREKGKAGEREVAHLFRKAGYWAERTRQSDGTNDPDVQVRLGEGMREAPISVEVKRRAKVAALRFLEQAAADAHPGREPVVFLREDGNTEWAVLVPAPFFMALLAEHPSFTTP